MAARCIFPKCLLRGLYRCGHCEAVVCNEHWVIILSNVSFATLKTIPTYATTEKDQAYIRRLPQREFEVFQVTAHRFAKNGACAMCQVLYGKQALAALPQRPVLPPNPAHALYVLKKHDTWFTQEEVAELMQARGGYPAVIAEICRINPTTHFYGTKGTHDAVLLKTLDPGGRFADHSNDAQGGPLTAIYTERERQILVAHGETTFLGWSSPRHNARVRWRQISAEQALQYLTADDLEALLKP